MTQPLGNPILAIYQYDQSTSQMQAIQGDVRHCVDHLFPSSSPTPELDDKGCGSRTWQYIANNTVPSIVDAFKWIQYQTTSFDARRPQDREFIIREEQRVVTHHFANNTYEVIASENHEAHLNAAREIETKFVFLKERVALKCEGTMQERLEAYSKKVQETVPDFDIHKIDVQLLPLLGDDFETLNLKDMEGEVPDCIQHMTYLKQIFHTNAQKESLEGKISEFESSVDLVQTDVSPTQEPTETEIEDTTTSEGEVVEEAAEPEAGKVDPFEGVDFKSRESIEEFVKSNGWNMGECRGDFWEAGGSHIPDDDTDWVDQHFTTYPDLWKQVFREKLEKSAGNPIRKTKTVA